ncbi:TetR/AcrR family transcriptional regulator [Chondrinema litorale]|uniref:TetR/AcrR family transcriptional regulator n=1 Tax=Chondrinema litorale TaxID=2994555 RepID=UPI0025436C79|nr:TetR/AcrR family transcriptional regulator [Chondrinema litorale]UZR98249.1 TetR/AcrR family transcriptional regulator [Chondrinema litorale]
MATRDTGTEENIKSAAKKVFFVEGKLNATTQDIANEAGVNRTLLNYYFRTREALFDQVYKEALSALAQKMNEVFKAELPFRQKVENIIDVFLEDIITYPFKEIFLISEINSEHAEIKKSHEPENPVFRNFAIEVEEAMKRGEVNRIKAPYHFIINLFSLMAYPVIIRPLNEKLLNFTKEEYDEILKNRKSEIIELLLN